MAQAGQTLPLDMAMLDYQWRESDRRESDIVYDTVGYGPESWPINNGRSLSENSQSITQVIGYHLHNSDDL